ncbi:MAG: NAD(P)H-dependent oxidoreductase subunit E [Planctomycetia bacterium]|nr:NAD(P)H-dependent oxidoreductase subunit E [Planctomycetia bacterium]
MRRHCLPHKGAPDIGEKIADVLQVKKGETTPDYKFTHKTVACLGTCFWRL